MASPANALHIAWKARDADQSQRGEDEQAFLPAVEFLARARFEPMINSNRHKDDESSEENQPE